MQTCPPEELLEAYLDEQAEAEHGVDSAAKWADLEAHVEDCLSCCRKLDLLTGKGTADNALAPPEGDFLLRLVTSPGEMLARQQAKVQLPQIDGYEILAELGHGGMGMVYKARHLQLRRLVALKMLVSGSNSHPEELARFQREAEAVACLQHPSIVQIHAIGEYEGRPFFSLEYVEGGTLAQKLGGDPQPARQAAQLVETLARAVHFAHEHGIVHRDLKPGNVLLMKDGTPKIADFGLAKQLDGDQAQTRTGVIIGTPSYMAPEQAAGKANDVGPLCDIYALGAMLYEMLTGRPPFKGGSTWDTLDQVRTQEPLPPTRLQPKLPRDLETICLKCLQKEPRRRYANAEQLADDLKRWLAGEPILARPVGRPERMWRWCRRKPAVAGLLAALMLALLGGFAGMAWQWLRAEERRKQAETLVIQLKFEDAIRQPGENRAWSMLSAPGLLRDAIALENRPLQDSLRLHLGSWFQEAHRLKHVLSHTHSVLAVAFSPAGKGVLTGSSDNTARLWDAATGKLFGQPLKHQAPVEAMAFSPDGTKAITTNEDKSAQLWDTATGKQRAPLPHDGYVRAVAFSRDGKFVATGSHDKTARVWDAATGDLLASLRHEDTVHAVAFSPGGETVLTGSGDRRARLCERATGKLRRFLPHESAVRAVAFSPDGSLLITGSENDRAQVWETATGKPLGPPLHHQNWISAVAFSPDGRTLATGSDDGTARLWDTATGQPLGPPLRHQGAVRALAFSPDGKTVLTASEDKTARLWEIVTARSFGPTLRQEGVALAMAFSPDGRSVVTSKDNGARLWDMATGKPLGPMLQHEADVEGVRFSRDGKILLTVCKDHTARLWDTATRKQLGEPMRHEHEICAAAFSPDGETVLTGSEDHTARLWDAATGKELRSFTHDGYVVAVAFSPDGNTVLTGSWDDTAQRWETATGKRLGQPMRHQTRVSAVAFSPDGKTVLTGCWDGTARLWETATGKPLGPPMRHQTRVSAVAFSPDGKTLLTRCKDNTAWLWETATGQPLGSPQHHAGSLLAAAFSTDGKTLLTGSSDGTLRLWRVPTPIEGDPERILLWAQVITGLELDEHGGTRPFDAATWEERRQRLQQLGGPPDIGH